MPARNYGSGAAILTLRLELLLKATSRPDLVVLAIGRSRATIQSPPRSEVWPGWEPVMTGLSLFTAVINNILMAEHNIELYRSRRQPVSSGYSVKDPAG
jgi:hypothetical protein